MVEAKYEKDKGRMVSPSNQSAWGSLRAHTEATCFHQRSVQAIWGFWKQHPVLSTYTSGWRGKIHSIQRPALLFFLHVPPQRLCPWDIWRHSLLSMAVTGIPPRTTVSNTHPFLPTWTNDMCARGPVIWLRLGRINAHFLVCWRSPFDFVFYFDPPHTPTSKTRAI